VSIIDFNGTESIGPCNAIYNPAVGKRFRIVIKPNGGCCWPGVVKSSAIHVCRTRRVLNLYPKPFHPGPTTPRARLNGRVDLSLSANEFSSLPAATTIAIRRRNFPRSRRRWIDRTYTPHHCGQTYSTRLGERASQFSNFPLPPPPPKRHLTHPNNEYYDHAIA